MLPISDKVAGLVQHLLAKASIFEVTTANKQCYFKWEKAGKSFKPVREEVFSNKYVPQAKCEWYEWQAETPQDRIGVLIGTDLIEKMGNEFNWPRGTVTGGLGIVFAGSTGKQVPCPFFCPVGVQFVMDKELNCLRISEKGAFGARLLFDEQLDQETFDYVGEFIQTHVNHSVLVAMAANQLLQCKNISPHRNQFDVADTKRLGERLKTKTPANSYYTLRLNHKGEDIDLSEQAIAEEERESGGKMRRFHSVRGHIAVYTVNAPLFGKYVGQFYIPNHMRGNRRLGVIDKEYEMGKI